MVTRSFEKELDTVRKRINAALRSSFAAKQFRSELWLRFVGLGLNGQEIRNANNLEERRKRIDEFDTRKQDVERRIEMLWKSRRENKGRSEASRIVDREKQQIAHVAGVS